jgi:hypothetical protein
MVRATDLDGLAGMIPTERPRTRAEEVVAKYRRGRPLEAPVSARTSSDNLSQRVSAAPLARAAGITRRRVSLEENLKALGNTTGRADRSRIVRIELTPWCHVSVDTAKLGEMSEDTPDILGAALTQALQEERIQKGK